MLLLPSLFLFSYTFHVLVQVHVAVTFLKVVLLRNRASQVARVVKNLPMQETPVQFLGQEDPLEKG